MDASNIKTGTVIFLGITGGIIVAAVLMVLTSPTDIREHISDNQAGEQVADEVILEAVESTYLDSEEAVIIEDEKGGEEVLPIQDVLFEYIEVVDSCGPDFAGDCLNVRAGPGTEYPSVNRLRNGVVLPVGGKVERNGETWYQIKFREWIRYPERVSGDWFVNAAYVQHLLNEGQKDLNGDEDVSTTTKRIVVDKSEQMLRAYEGDELFMEQSISTGLALTPTPNGEFRVFRKTPSRYMQGPLPGISSEYWDLPGVPWNLYFTRQGAIVHGAYWHNNFGQPWSKGCVNVPLSAAEKLYKWAPLGTKVIIQQ